MNFLFEFLNIHMNEKEITCHDCHGFKGQNMNIYDILIIFLCNLMPFLANDCDCTHNIFVKIFKFKITPQK